MRVTSETRIKTACFAFAAASVVDGCFISSAILQRLEEGSNSPKSSWISGRPQKHEFYLPYSRKGYYSAFSDSF